MTGPGIVERIGAGRIMSDLLGERKIKGGLTNCINPTAHKNGDKNPSMSIDLDGGVFNCFACGVNGGALDFAVLRGYGTDKASAAAELEKKYGGSSLNSNRHHPKPAVSERPWPYFPTTAAALGWEIVESHNFPYTEPGRGLVVPTWNADGSKARTKVRGERDSNGKVRAEFLRDGDECGLINLPALMEHNANVEHPSCALVAGETDLLAWTWAMAAEGFLIPPVSLSTGEESTLDGDRLAPFRGVKVYIAYDNDDVGRKGAEKNAAALRTVAESVTILKLPDGVKDIRDYVMGGGKITALIQAPAKEAEKPARFTPIGGLDLLQKQLPEIEEIVQPRVIYRGGVTVLVASHKRGKSLAALGLCVDLVLAIAAPEYEPDEALPRWLGQRIIGRGPVLVYSAEGGERMVQERLAKMVPQPTETLNNLLVYAQTPAPQLDKPEDIDAVFAHAERVGAVLLVFDPLGRFWAMEDEADPTKARDLMLAIQVRAEKAYSGKGIAVLVIHHDTKSGGGDAESAVTGGRGSGKFGDDADALVNLKLAPEGEPGESVAKFLLRHAESPSPVPVKIDKKTLRLVEIGKSQQRSPTASKGGRPPKLSLGALEGLIRDKGQIDGIRVADALGVSDSTWEKNRKRMVGDLVEAGLIETRTHPGTNREFFIWRGVVAETQAGSSWEPL